MLYSDRFIRWVELFSETAPKLRTKYDYKTNLGQIIYDPSSLKGSISCEPPGKSIIHFDGKIKISNHFEKSIGINQLLFRVC